MTEGYDAGEQPASVPLGWALRLSLLAAVLAVAYLLGTSLFSAARMHPTLRPPRPFLAPFPPPTKAQPHSPWQGFRGRR